MSTDEELRTGFDPDARELCPDGACIGVIGSDGRCAECGKVSLKKPKARTNASQEPGPDQKPGREAPPPTAVPAEGLASTPSASRQVEGDKFDPAHRELCPDGACIGVIGSDGRCKECGKASARGSGGSSVESGASAAPQSETAPDESDPDLPADPDEDTPDTDGAPADIAERQLCPDGACIGVIGSNGRCKECGTRAE